MDNCYLILGDKSLYPIDIGWEGFEQFQNAIKRIGGPWVNGNKPYFAHILYTRDKTGRLPIDVYDIWVDMMAVLDRRDG